jgi:hypothetical protein
MISQLGHVKLVDFGHAKKLTVMESSIRTADVRIPRITVRKTPFPMPVYCCSTGPPPRHCQLVASTVIRGHTY